MSEHLYALYRIGKLMARNRSENDNAELTKLLNDANENTEKQHPEFRVRFEADECQEIPSENQFLRTMLKQKIERIMYEFTAIYAAKDGNIQGDSPTILIDVLTECLSEAQREVQHYAPFTSKQTDHICYQIGRWYFMMKPLLQVQHNLGHMKEQLKVMICGQGSGR